MIRYPIAKGFHVPVDFGMEVDYVNLGRCMKMFLLRYVMFSHTVSTCGKFTMRVLDGDTPPEELATLTEAFRFLALYCDGFLAAGEVLEALDRGPPLHASRKHVSRLGPWRPRTLMGHP